MQHKIAYEPALDGLRAIAVGLVIVRHMFPDTFPEGGVGVTLFFVLSGYLITRLLMQELRETGTISLGRFYLRRALRLMPALWTMLLIFLPMIITGHHRPAQLWSWSMAASYLMNFNRAFGWGSDYAFGHTWSLAAEEQFYWLWPAILLLGARKCPRLTVCTLFLAVTAWRLYLFRHGASIERVYSGPDADSDAILCGCLLGLVTVPQKAQKIVGSLWPVWLASLVFIEMAVRFELSPALMIGLSASCLAAIATLVASKNHLFASILSTKPLVFVGKISYAIYLWHWPLIVFMGAKWRLSGWALLFPVACSFVLATISYFTVEAYFRGVKRRLDQKPESPRPEWRPHQAESTVTCVDGLPLTGLVMRRKIYGEWQYRALSEAEARELDEDRIYFDAPP